MPPAELLLKVPLALLPPWYFSSEKSWMTLGEGFRGTVMGAVGGGLMCKRLPAAHVTHGRMMGTFSFPITGLSLLTSLNDC